MLDLDVDGLDPVEVSLVLGNYFQGSRGDASATYYPADDTRIIVDHARKSSPRYVAGPNFDPSEVPTIRAHLTKSLRENQSPKITAFVGFASSSLEGSYRPMGGTWMLHPAPEHAPRPTSLVGSGNPVLLYETVPDSSDWAVLMRRRSQAFEQRIAILNALLAAGLTAASSRGFHWVLHRQDDKLTSAWEQDWYEFAGFQAYPEAFPPPNERIRTVSEAEYYSGHAVAANLPFCVPDGLDGDLQRFDSLLPADRDRLLNSGRWRTLANRLFFVSAGTWYLAQVAAIEALLPRVRRHLCPECRQPVGPGPTALFKDFIETYAPGFANRSELSKLYDVRSSLVHGLGQLASDTSSFGYEPVHLEEMGQFELLRRIVSVATVNWLRDGAAPAITADSRDRDPGNQP
jgi:hypothetical protein